MKALAARRYHRNAPLALLVLALALTAGIWAVVASSAADTAPASVSTNDVATGEKIFQANCSTCHGPAAAGTAAGPSLIGVGAASVDFQVGTGRMPMAASGAQAPVKDVVFTQEQIGQLAAWVASLGAGPAIPTAEQVDPALGDPANGGALFRTNCSMCHNAVGAGGALSRGKYAPALTDTTPSHIWSAMVTGPQSMPVFNNANISPEEKRDVIAFIDEQRNVSPGGLSLGSLGPVAEGFWVFLIGIGLLIASAVWIGAKSS